jgi:hypothetical protein
MNKTALGPWTQEVEFESAERKQKTGWVCILDANGEYICKVPKEVSNLIAAAPELLEACQAIRDGWQRNLTEPIALINVAIRKATTPCA